MKLKFFILGIALLVVGVIALYFQANHFIVISLFGFATVFLFLSLILVSVSNQLWWKKQTEITAQTKPLSLSKLEEIYPECSEEELKELQAYDICLQRTILENEPGAVVLNSDHRHAAILLSKMLDQTKEKIWMVVGTKFGELQDNLFLMGSLDSCLKKNVKVNILFIEGIQKNGRLLTLLDRPLGDAKLYQATRETRELICASKMPHYFSVFDGTAYRTEYEPHTALGSFNDPENAEKLLKLFSELAASATQINLC